MAEIDEIIDGLFRDVHIVDKLGLMLREKLADRLQLDDETAEDKQVWDVTLLQLATFVEGSQILLRPKGMPRISNSISRLS